MATIDDVYAQNVTILANLATLQTDINTIKTSMTTLLSDVETLDNKVDVLSGDTTPTNTLDKVLGIERRVKAMEFKLIKGR